MRCSCAAIMPTRWCLFLGGYGRPWCGGEFSPGFADLKAIRRLEIPMLQIAQQPPQFSVADLVTSRDQFLEQLRHEQHPLGGLQWPYRIGDGGDLRGGENHGRLARLIRRLGDCRSRNKISSACSSRVIRVSARMVFGREACPSVDG